MEGMEARAKYLVELAAMKATAMSAFYLHRQHPSRPAQGAICE
jgi:hypothetical protein